MNELYIAHHGVLGMKWGIRRYQPYGPGEKGRFVGKVKEKKFNKKADLMKSKVKNEYVDSRDYFSSWTEEGSEKAIEDQKHERIIEKGSLAYRYTTSPSEKHKGRTYVYFSENDNWTYNDGDMGITGSQGITFRNQYKLKKDLKLPSIETITRAYLDVVTESSKDFDMSNEEIAKRIGKDNLLAEFSLKKNSHLTLKDAKKKISKIFTEDPNGGLVFAMGSILKDSGDNLGVYGDKLVAKLESMGYDGMTDLNDMSNNYHTPTFIFDKEKSLSTVKTMSSKYNHDTYGLETFKDDTDGFKEKYKMKYLS